MIYYPDELHIGSIKEFSVSERDRKHRKIVRQRTILAVTAVLIIGSLLIAGIIFIPKAVDHIKAGIEARKAAAEAEAAAQEAAEAEEEAPPAAEEPREEIDEDDLQSRVEEVINTEAPPEVDTDIRDKISVMTNAQRVAQLFVVTPESLTGVDTATAAGDATRAALSENTVGGIIYLAKNIVEPQQLQEMLYNTQTYALSANGLPLFLAVDEEGGAVNRVALNEAFKDELPEADARTVTKELSPEGLYTVANNIGKYLKKYGFNVDLAPVADIALSDNSIMAERSFGSEEEYVTDMAVNFASGLKDAGVISCYKHFPGFGRAGENTDFASVSINAISEELKSIDSKPFERGIENGLNMIMISSAMYPGLDENPVPASMSGAIVTDYLKGELGFKGVVISDALNAVAIADKYEPGEAAVAAFKAGCDLLLMPADYDAAFKAVLEAYESGEISNERLEDALTRILTVKKEIDTSYLEAGAETDSAETAEEGEQAAELEEGP